MGSVEFLRIPLGGSIKWKPTTRTTRQVLLGVLFRNNSSLFVEVSDIYAAFWVSARRSIAPRTFVGVIVGAGKFNGRHFRVRLIKTSDRI